ncbi:hypothetical protein [Phyllobacterium endophyticum]|uniref:hypothetical protein n=1 Tax=Phyllobacterium endophyticum TaxID=1149773 RepID=UPI0011C9C585|nr:hypothetical protein [Phyllobacterium endophyticum]TXR51135.1 hypothetical protein FVA77_01315 [Phyllobacterium endophyticum]
MTKIHLFATIVLASSGSFLAISPLGAGERMGFPPPDPPGTVRPAMTAENIQKELEQRLNAQFEAAAGPSGKLTAQKAKDAGWGFVADHFNEISKSGRSSVSLNDIRTFMSVRSPLTPVTSKAIEKKPIQIIE